MNSKLWFKNSPHFRHRYKRYALDQLIYDRYMFLLENYDDEHDGRDIDDIISSEFRGERQKITKYRIRKVLEKFARFTGKNVDKSKYLEYDFETGRYKRVKRGFYKTNFKSSEYKE